MSVLIKIREMRGLPEAEDSVRKYILENLNDFMTKTVRELADLSFTSPATVTRFCRKVEAQGYNMLKIRLAAELESYKNLNMDIVESMIIDAKDSIEEVESKVTQISIDSIRETNLLLDRKVLEKAARLICERDIVDLYGLGSSNIVATDAAYKFMRIGKVVQCFQLVDRQKVQALNSDSSHIAILFSFSGETEAINEIAHSLLKNGTPTIAVVGKINSSLARIVEDIIYVSAKETTFRSGAMASRTASMYIVDLLYTLCNLYDYDKSTQQIAKTRIGL